MLRVSRPFVPCCYMFVLDGSVGAKLTKQLLKQKTKLFRAQSSALLVQPQPGLKPLQCAMMDAYQSP